VVELHARDQPALPPCTTGESEAQVPADRDHDDLGDNRNPTNAGPVPVVVCPVPLRAIRPR
jgi:hypothetical protein